MNTFRFSLCVSLLLLTIDAPTQAQPPTVIPVRETQVSALVEVLKTVRELRASGMNDAVTIQLMAGHYQFDETLKLDPEVVGNGLNITGPVEGEAIFSGGIALKGEADTSGNWQYQLPANWRKNGVPRAIVINGELQTAARFPDEGYLRIEHALEDHRSGFIAKAGDLPDDLDLTGNACDLILLHDWSSSRLPVASYNFKERELRTLGPIGCAASHYAIDHFEKQPRYWLEGHSSFANLPGEWYVDQTAGTVVVKGHASEPAAPDLILPVLDEILIASGDDNSSLKNLVLQKITFTGTRFPMPAGGLAGAQATMHEPRDEQGKRTSSGRPMLKAGVRIEIATGCRVNNCRFQAMGGTGLWLGSRTNQCKVFRCNFEGIGGNGLNMGEDNARGVQGNTWYKSAPEQIPTDNLIEQCEITRCGTVLPGAVAVWAPLNNGLNILNNHIHDCPYTGISLGWIWNDSKTPAGKNRIQDNRIQFVMQVLSDGGGIYTLGNQPDSMISGNLISDVPLNAGRAESNGMFLDEGSTGFTIQGNTIRRIDRSPIRFHKAGKNVVTGNAWELATAETPAVRFNNTPPENITIEDNTVLEPQVSIFLIGNSLTWDTIPSRLEGNVHWHVDCGKNLTYIHDHPQSPCVSSSRVWPIALNSTQYDLISVQPHYGTTITEDVARISEWMERQPKAVFIIHTGWAKHAQLQEEYADTDPAGPLTHSVAYYDELLKQLREKHPGRELRSTKAIQLLQQIQEDIKQQQAPFEKIEDIYRDAIHMKLETGRYLMHNAMRHAMGQPRTSEDFPEIPVEVKTYLDELLDSLDKI